MGTQPPPPKGDRAPFPFLLWPNGWMHQDATWFGCRPHLRGLSVRWRPSPLAYQGAPKSSAHMFIVAKRLDGSRCNLDEGKPQPRRLYVRWRPNPLPTKGVELPPQFSAHFYCGQTAGCIKMPLGVEVGLSPGGFIKWGPSPYNKRRGAPPNFRPMYIVAKRLKL